MLIYTLSDSVVVVVPFSKLLVASLYRKYHCWLYLTNVVIQYTCILRMEH